MGAQQQRRSTKRVPEDKQQLSVYLPIETFAEVRGAAKRLMGLTEGPNTLSELVNEAIVEKLARLRRDLNGGDEFPPFLDKLPTGPVPKP